MLYYYSIGMWIAEMWGLRKLLDIFWMHEYFLFRLSCTVNLLGFVMMLHSYYYISLFVSCVNIPVGLDNLFQRIASIYYRF